MSEENKFVSGAFSPTQRLLDGDQKMSILILAGPKEQNSAPGGVNPPFPDEPERFFIASISHRFGDIAQQILNKVSVPHTSLTSKVSKIGMFEGPKTFRFRHPIQWKERRVTRAIERRPTVRTLTKIILEKPRGWNEKLKVATKLNHQLEGPPQIDYRTIVYRNQQQLEKLLGPFASCDIALKFMAIKAHVKFQVPVELSVKWARNLFPVGKFPGFSISVMTIRKDGNCWRYTGQEAVTILTHLPSPGKSWKTTDFPLAIRQDGWNLEFQGFAMALVSYLKGTRKLEAKPYTKAFEELSSNIARQIPVHPPKKLGGDWNNFCNLQTSLYIQAEVCMERTLFNKIRDVTMDNFFTSGDSWSTCPDLTAQAEKIGMGPPPYEFMGIRCTSEALLSIRRLTRVAVKNVLKNANEEVIRAAKSLVSDWPRRALSDDLRKIISEDDWIIPIQEYLNRIPVAGLENHPYATLGRSTRSRGAANACCVGRTGGFSSSLRLIVVNYLLSQNIDPGSILRDHIDKDDEFSDLIRNLTDSKERYFEYADLACRELLKDRIDHLAICTNPKCESEDLHFEAPYVGILPFREGGSKLRTFTLVDTALMFLASGPASILCALLKRGETAGEMFRGVEWSTGKRLNEGLRNLLGGEEDIFFLSLDSSRSTDFLRASLSRKLITVAYKRLSDVVMDVDYDLRILSAVFAPIRLYSKGGKDQRPKPIYRDIPTYTSERFAAVALNSRVRDKQRVTPRAHPGFVGIPTERWKRRGLGLEAFSKSIQEHCLLGTFILVAPTGYGKSIALPEICSSMSLGGRKIKTIVFQPTTGIIESIHKENPEVSTLAMRYKVLNDSAVTYATGFYFLNELNKDHSKFNCFVLDEIHLRRPDQLFALLLMRNRPAKNRIFVVTGATIDSGELSHYLSCPVLTIQPPPGNLEERYLTRFIDKSDVVSESLDFLKGKWGSVLIFGEQITHSEELAKTLSDNFPGSERCNYHGLCLPHERLAALSDLESGKLRFIATSEMAELGATFRRTILVINFRTTWLNMEDLKLGATCLVKIRSDNKTDTQRAGRCGRRERGQELVKGLVLEINGKITGRPPSDPKHYVGEISSLLDLSTTHNVKIADLDLSLNLEQWKRVLSKDSIVRSPVVYAASEACKAIGASGFPGDILLAACLTEQFPGRGELVTWKGTTAMGIRARWEDQEIITNVDKLVAQRFLHWMGFDMVDLNKENPIVAALPYVMEPSAEAIHEAIKFYSKTDRLIGDTLFWEIKLRVSLKGEITGLYRVKTCEELDYKLEVSPLSLKQEIGMVAQETVVFGVSKAKGQVIKGLNYRPSLNSEEQKTVSLRAWRQWAEEEGEAQKELRDWYLTKYLGTAFDISPMSSVASVCALSLTNLSIRICPYYYKDRILKVRGGQGITAGYGDDISSIGDGSQVALVLFGMEYVQQDPNSKTVLSECRRDGRLYNSALVQTECVYRFSPESEALERESILKLRFILSTFSEGLTHSGCTIDRVNTWAYRRDFISSVKKVCPAFESNLVRLFDTIYTSQLSRIREVCNDLTPLGYTVPGDGSLDCTRILANCVPSVKTASRLFVDMILESNIPDTVFEPKNVMGISDVKDAIEVLVLPMFPPRKSTPKTLGIEESIRLAQKPAVAKDHSKAVLCFSDLMDS